jgi:hypothetical protein
MRSGRYRFALNTNVFLKSFRYVTAAIPFEDSCGIARDWCSFVDRQASEGINAREQIAAKQTSERIRPIKYFAFCARYGVTSLTRFFDMRVSVAIYAWTIYTAHSTVPSAEKS